MTKIMKNQLKHTEKNLINLEDTSDVDSSAKSSETEKIDISLDCDKEFDDVFQKQSYTKPIDHHSVLSSINKSTYSRPSLEKKKLARKQSKKELMKQISMIIRNKNGTISTKSPNSPEMSAIILTRWAKRRLKRMKEIQEI